MTETFSDSKKEVDVNLKRSCEQFIADVTSQLLGPLKAFLEKVGQSAVLFATYELCSFSDNVHVHVHVPVQA